MLHPVGGAMGITYVHLRLVKVAPNVLRVTRKYAKVWPTCMMTSCTRAGVKVRQLAIENVWGIPNAC